MTLKAPPYRSNDMFLKNEKFDCHIFLKNVHVFFTLRLVYTNKVGKE